MPAKRSNLGSMGRAKLKDEHWASPVRTYEPPWMWSWADPPVVSEWQLVWDMGHREDTEVLDMGKSLRRRNWKKDNNNLQEQMAGAVHHRRVPTPRGSLLKGVGHEGE